MGGGGGRSTLTWSPTWRPLSRLPVSLCERCSLLLLLSAGSTENEACREELRPLPLPPLPPLPARFAMVRLNAALSMPPMADFDRAGARCPWRGGRSVDRCVSRLKP